MLASVVKYFVADWVISIRSSELLWRVCVCESCNISPASWNMSPYVLTIIIVVAIFRWFFFSSKKGNEIGDIEQPCIRLSNQIFQGFYAKHADSESLYGRRYFSSALRVIWNNESFIDIVPYPHFKCVFFTIFCNHFSVWYCMQRNYSHMPFGSAPKPTWTINIYEIVKKFRNEALCRRLRRNSHKINISIQTLLTADCIL